MQEKEHILHAIRNDFPILQEKIYGKSLVYLDNGASAQKPFCVIEAMKDFSFHNYANVHRAMHFLSNRATEAYENARLCVKRFLNSADKQEIIFTKNATEAINLVAYSWAMEHINEDDEIIVTVAEHHSNIVPWHFVRQKKGARIKFIPLMEDGGFSFSALEKAITKKTKLIAVTHMSNILGTIYPIKSIVQLAKAHNITTLVDGAQAAVHLPVDVQDLDCDFYVFTGHKVYGPTGIGVLYGKKAKLEEMVPFLGGGEMVDIVDMEQITYNSLPYCFEAGTPPIIEAVGLAKALDYISSFDRSFIVKHEKDLSTYLYEGLKTIEGIKVLGALEQKNSIFSFYHEDIHAHDIAVYLDKNGIAIRSGTHCAQILLKFFSVSSVCRASIAMYNNKADIERFITSLEKAISFFKSI